MMFNTFTFEFVYDTLIEGGMEPKQAAVTAHKIYEASKFSLQPLIPTPQPVPFPQNPWGPFYPPMGPIITSDRTNCLNNDALMCTYSSNTIQEVE